MFKILGFTLFALVAVACGVSERELIAEEWKLFKLQYEKDYESFMEEKFRFKIFQENKNAIAAHNKLFAEGKVSFEMDINHLSDMLLHEIVDTIPGLSADSNKNKLDQIETSTFISNPYIALPKRLDWRDKGAVTPVKQQAGCWSCWAFSATGALEGQWFLKTNRSISLSEQNLVDCSKENLGCLGGWTSKAFHYIKNNKGIDTEEAYPYVGFVGQCHYSPKDKGAIVTGIVAIPNGDEAKLMEAVAIKGPISVHIEVDYTFLFYKSGVYDSSVCGQRQNHAVLIIGYGTENGIPYWLVKNSWGNQWGNGGYIKMTRNKNLCGIADYAMYPLV